MFDDLNSHFLQYHKISLWEQKDFKYFDVCAGRGNYSAVLFGKLFNGLKNTKIFENDK
jgi:hypothetical protein